jgi:hypothetical protein
MSITTITNTITIKSDSKINSQLHLDKYLHLQNATLTIVAKFSLGKGKAYFAPAC